MRIVMTAIMITAAIQQPAHNDHQANIVLYVACLAQLRFFRLLSIQTCVNAESPNQQSNYCFGYIPTGMCLCPRGQAVCLEWIIEVLMWTSSVIVLPLRSRGPLPVMDLI